MPLEPETNGVNALAKNGGGVARARGLLKLICAIVALAVVLAAPSATVAQPVSDADRARLEVHKEALFQQMLSNPANLDVTFAYADVSARLGDYEAAVSALDRMLLFNPNLPRVQLEIGALYFRMGSTTSPATISKSRRLQPAARGPGPHQRIPGADRKQSIAPSHLRLFFSRRPIPDRRQCRARLAADPVADRAGAAEQPVCQAALGQRFRQRVVVVQL